MNRWWPVLMLVALLGAVALTARCRAETYYLHPDGTVSTTPPAVRAQAPAPPADDYYAIRGRALADGVPVVFFVNQPARQLPGVRCYAGEDAGRPPYVTLLTPIGGAMHYLDVPGEPPDNAILGKLGRAPRAVAQAPAVGNVGHCPCKSDGGPCLCVPASNCARGLCPPKPAVVPRSTLYAPVAFGVCRT